MFEKLRLLKSTSKKEMSPQLLKAVDSLLNYEKHAQKIIREKLPDDYRHIAQHALNVSSIAVGFVPGSHILDYIKKIQEATLIEKKRKEQANSVDDTEQTETVKELRETIGRAEKELKDYKKNQATKKIITEEKDSITKELELLLNETKKEEITEVQILESLFKDLKKHEERIVKTLSKSHDSDFHIGKNPFSKNQLHLEIKPNIDKKKTYEIMTIIENYIHQDIEQFASLVAILESVEKREHNVEDAKKILMLISESRYFTDDNQSRSGIKETLEHEKIVYFLIKYIKIHSLLAIQILNEIIRIIQNNNSEAEQRNLFASIIDCYSHITETLHNFILEVNEYSYFDVMSNKIEPDALINHQKNYNEYLESLIREVTEIIPGLHITLKPYETELNSEIAK